jgi:fatty acid desaturase
MRAADILSILFTVCAIFFIFCLGALEYGCSQDSNLKGGMTEMDISSVLLLIAAIGAIVVLCWSLWVFIILVIALWVFTAHLIKNKRKEKDVSKV